MKNYLIYLPEYQNSVDLSSRAVNSAQQYGWKLDLYAGVNGNTAEWGSVKVNQTDAKCRAMLDLPGVRGCFLSHWSLWNLCIKMQQPLGIFEHDVVFCAEPPVDPQFADVFKMEGFLLKKPRPAGAWYEGARAYLISPQGAKKLVDWVNARGALPTDVAIGLDVVDIQLDSVQRIVPHALFGKTDKRETSFTWNLKGMK